MLENEWLSSNDPVRMLQSFAKSGLGQLTFAPLSDRKLQMFKAATFRAILPHNTEHERTALRIEKEPHWTNMCWLGHEKLHDTLAAALLRDVVGNPFKKTWTCCCDPDVGIFTCEWCDGLWGWKKWNGGCIPVLARQMYDSRDFSQMPLLGDMLEDADCTDPHILNHCRAETHLFKDNAVAYYYTDVSGSQLTSEYARQAHVHVRGCWAIDLILGNK